MNLHEYQGKEIFAKYDLPVSKGKVVTSLDEVEQACTDIGGSRWVAKAHVLLQPIDFLQYQYMLAQPHQGL